jgi:CubicO group peptidase (beta-lactamase class C family)
MVKFTFLPLLASLGAAYLESPHADNGTIQGFDTQLLKVLNDEMHKWVDAKKGANVVTLLARKGEIVNFDAYGVLDASAEDSAPVKKDTIFRIMSMTKPVVGIAFAMLYEEGKWKLDDPVSKHIPEFADLKVKLPDGTLVPQDKPIVLDSLEC